MNNQNKICTTFIGIMLLLLMTYATLNNDVDAHLGKLLNVNGKDYWIAVASVGESGVVDVLGGAEVYIYEADPLNPLDRYSDNRKPVEGMNNILKFDIIAGGKNKTFDLHQIWNSSGPELGHYEAPFIPTVKTTYDYRLFGDWSGTQFDVTWSCTHGQVPESPQKNETITLSNGVIQKAEGGGYSCPTAIEDISFPEKSMSNVDIQTKLNQTEQPLS